MIPILYEKTEIDFTTYGIGALSDVTSCVCTEERNGQYELLMTYPITGKLYDEIQAERIIKAKAKPLGDDQLFRIYRMSRPIRGIVTIYAQHISYDLSGVALSPFTGTYAPSAAMTYIFTSTGFTGHTDKSGSQTFGTATPKSVRSMLGGTQGSMLDIWGGEYKWDNFDVYLYTNRGLNKNVVIEYGKNLTDLVADNDLSAVYSELLPFATYQDESGSHTVTGDPIAITSVITRTKTLIKDFSLEFDGPMTKAQVDTLAASWLADNPLGYETPSLTVSFTNLLSPVNYPAAAATIDLCDTVTIRYTALGVDVQAKVVACEYDTLLERYTKLTVGKPRASMANTVANLTDQVQETLDYPSLWKSAIEVATEMITGNAGGNVVLHEGPDGKPFELLVMDDPDITQATKIWRWTLGGLGYSTNGYAGPYELAITADGKINANFIQTGAIDASLITTGRLLVKDSSNNVLFDADISTKTVSIAGFTVKENSLEYTKYTQSGSGALASYNDEETIHVGTDRVQKFTRVYELSDSNTVFAAATAASVEAEGHEAYFIVENDRSNDPDDRFYDRAQIESDEINLYHYNKRSNGTILKNAMFYTDGVAFSDWTGSQPYSSYKKDGWDVSNNGQYSTYADTGGVYASSNDYYTRLQHSGILFYNPQTLVSNGPIFTVMQRVHTDAESETFAILDGVYLAIVSHNNNSTANEQGLYLIQCRTSGSSVVRTIASANSTTLTISGANLTWATTNTYRTLTLIRVSA